MLPVCAQKWPKTRFISFQFFLTPTFLRLALFLYLLFYLCDIISYKLCLFCAIYATKQKNQ